MHFLVRVFDLHQSAVEDALASNRRLARELQYDLERFKAAQQPPKAQLRDNDGDGNNNDGDDDDVIDDSKAAAPIAKPALAAITAPTPHRPAAATTAAATVATPFRTPSRARIAAATEKVPLSAAKIKPAATAATTASANDEAPVAARPKTPWSSLRVKSMLGEAASELDSVATALSFGAANADDADNADAFRCASTPKPKARPAEKENAASSSRKGKRGVLQN